MKGDFSGGTVHRADPTVQSKQGLEKLLENVNSNLKAFESGQRVWMSVCSECACEVCAICF